ncbi:MAG TPA: hypothetical protein VL524_16005 [Gemmatimonadaceae bacterium]|nr:hypothetical protein [Gemmatimonadaceae bacterium]
MAADLGWLDPGVLEMSYRKVGELAMYAAVREPAKLRDVNADKKAATA